MKNIIIAFFSLFIATYSFAASAASMSCEFTGVFANQKQVSADNFRTLSKKRIKFSGNQLVNYNLALESSQKTYKTNSFGTQFSTKFQLNRLGDDQYEFAVFVDDAHVTAIKVDPTYTTVPRTRFIKIDEKSVSKVISTNRKKRTILSKIIVKCSQGKRNTL